MRKGACQYRKPAAYNTRRINLSGVSKHVLPYLQADLRNYTKAVYRGIKSCGVDQSKTRKNIRDAAISHLKSLITKYPHLKESLRELQGFKIQRTKDPKQPVIRPKHIDQIIALIDASNREPKQKILDRTLVWTLFYTGMRLQEVVNLKIEDIDLERNRIFINHSKGGKSRVIAINRNLKPILEKYTRVFLTTNLNHFFLLPNGMPLKHDRLYRRITKLTKSIGLDGGCHQFRRGWVTANADKGVPIPYLQVLAGHSNIQTTMSYYKPDLEAILSAQIEW